MADDLRILIVDGSPRQSSPELVAGLAEECDLTIAVDHGAEACLAAGVVPDAFCGDADSVSDEARAWVQQCSVPEELLPVEKDATDLVFACELAERLAADRGAKSWKPVLTCATGGWPDHELGVMGVLRDLAPKAPMLVEDGFQALVLCPEGQASWQMDVLARGNTFSLVPLTDCVVTEENMYWELDHEPLKALSERGVSNIVTTGFARVEAHEGVVLAFLFWGRR